MYIHAMNLNSLDLNLLVALDALLREANVSRAAMRIGLSQPAASHALQRLRDLIGDPLLVRVGARMELTPRAIALRGPLAQTLEQVRGLFVPDAFDAARSDRQFRLMMPDLAVELLMPPLMAQIAELAPNVRIDVVPWQSSAIFTPEFARTIDLVISLGNAFNGFHRQPLYTDSDALAVRRGHPLGARLRKKEVFLNAQHVAVIKRGQEMDLIDRWLRPMGIERKIALVVPGYIEAMKRKVPASVTECAELIEHKFLKGPWVMGEQYTICDPYLHTIELWLEGDSVDLKSFPRVADHMKRMSERPAVKKVMGEQQAKAA